MTAKSRANLKSVFEQGDTPQGSDYADLIDSFLNLSDSTAQTVTSPVTYSNTVTLGGLNMTMTVVVSASTIPGGEPVPATAKFVPVSADGGAYMVALFARK